jgi:hypothetical protein
LGGISKVHHPCNSLLGNTIPKLGFPMQNGALLWPKRLARPPGHPRTRGRVPAPMLQAHGGCVPFVADLEAGGDVISRARFLTRIRINFELNLLHSGHNEKYNIHTQLAFNSTAINCRIAKFRRSNLGPKFALKMGPKFALTDIFQNKMGHRYLLMNPEKFEIAHWDMYPVRSF